MLIQVIRDLITSRKHDDAMLQEARALCEASRFRDAMKCLDGVIERKPRHLEALLIRGMAARDAGLGRESLIDLTRAVELDPRNPKCMYELAHTSYATGNHARAFELCEKTRRIAPDFAPARWLQAQVILGGEHYFRVLERIHQVLRPRTYFEIGVFRGESLALAKGPTLAIGVDPKPVLIVELAENQKVFAQTSDDFFAQHDLRHELSGQDVDLAFIDGLHKFEYALKDFINLERYCGANSTILLHDCYPLDRETAVRDDGPTSFWSGDVWRLIVLLKKYRPDLRINVLGAPPTGLAVIRDLKPDSRLLAENYDALCTEFMGLDYGYLDDDKPGKLNLVKNEWANALSLLS